MPSRAASPHLKIRRIVVTGELTLDLSLHSGLNVVYAPPTQDPKASNRAGKTALVELIRYGLGRREDDARGYHFEPIRRQLDTLFLEFEANDRVLTTRRSLARPTAHMAVHPGPYTPDLAEAEGEVIPIPDVSGILLSQLGIPSVDIKTARGELEPLSFPLLMRAFVLHQKDSFGGILDKVYPEVRKTQIIGFLTKIVPVASWEYEGRLSEAQQLVTQLERRFEGTREFLREHGIASVLEAAEAVRFAEIALSGAQAARIAAQQQIRNTGGAYQQGDGRLERLRNELLTLQTRRADVAQVINAREAEEDRIRALIASLQADEERTERLHTASVLLSTVDFDLCPRCLQDVTSDMRERERYQRCMLCSRPLTVTSDAIPRAAPSAADLADQVAEAELMLADLRVELDARLTERATLQGEEARLARLVEEESRAYVSPALDQLLALSEELSRRERELAEAQVRHQQAEALRDLGGELERTRNDFALLQQERDDARRASQQRVTAFRRIYETILRAVGFPRLNTVRLERTLMPLINNQAYTHEGVAYTGLATVVYHLALLRFALSTDTFFPDCLVIDSPAVGDLNDENHDRLLNYLGEVQAGAWGDDACTADGTPRWQIILTTRRRPPALESVTVMEIFGREGQMLLRPRERRRRRTGPAL